MNFDKANTEVTRHSYGSRVDKEFKREGVIPVKNRNKNDVDYAAETAKYNELNKKVENRRFNDIKEQKSFDEALSKGYDNLRESLLKDIMYEICIESMWVDRDNIDNNIRNVMNLVDEQVEAIGGYKGFKEIAESTNNQLLLNMVKDCEEMCKIVGIRNITEAAGNASKLDFEMNKAEMDEFDYRKKSFGSETIINAVRDKVLDVVKYEQEANTAKQEVMDEIQMKAGEIGAPVGEAMEFIFNEKIEETTLFDSLMRKNYKNLLESNCSYIFESEGVDEEDYEFEDDEFKMSDIELTDEEDEDDIKNMFLENAYSDIQGLLVGSSEEVLEESLNSILETLNTATACKSKSDAIRVKEDIRNLQVKLMEGNDSGIAADNIPTEAVKNNKKVKEEVIICPECGKDPCKCKTVNESYEVVAEGLLQKLKDKFKKVKVKNPLDMDYDELKDNVENAKKLYQQNVTNGTINIEEPNQVHYYTSEMENEKERIKNMISVVEKDESEEAGKKVWILKHYYEWLDQFEANLINNMTKYIRNDIKDCKTKLTKSFSNCNDVSQYREFVTAVTHLISYYRKLGNLVNLPEIQSHCKWLESMHEKACSKADIGKGPLVFESYEGEPITEGVLKNKIVMAYDNYKNKKLNKVDFEKLRNSMIQIAANAKTIKDLDVLDRDVDFSIAELEKMKKPENEEKVTFHIEFLNKEYKKFLAEKREEMNKQKCVESFVDKLDNYCDKLSHIIESHELARNSAVSSLTYEIEEQNVFVPYIQPNDCNLSNLEFAYKAKMVCESLKSELKNVNNENDFMIIEKAVDMNLQSIHESLEAIKDMEKMDYKKSTLKSCEGYLNKIKHVIDNNVAPNNPVVESTSVFGSDDDVERIFNRVKEYTLIESTNNKLMETVMAESIVEYTIIEAFNTLNLLKFDKESVRRMSRNNLK